MTYQFAFDESKTPHTKNQAFVNHAFKGKKTVSAKKLAQNREKVEALMQLHRQGKVKPLVLEPGVRKL